MSDLDRFNIAEDRSVLCAANSYTSKFYLNPIYAKLPQGIREDIQKICVSLSEEAGGIAVMSFDGEGILSINSFADESDYYYDNVSAGLLINQIERQHRELFENISDFYRMRFLDLPPLSEE